MKSIKENKTLFNMALHFAVSTHEEQEDKAGVPYIFHVMRVAGKFKPYSDEQIVAILHDTVEDGLFTDMNMIRRYFTPEIAEAVDAITHRKGEQNARYIERCCQNEIAMKVKTEDVLDNVFRLNGIKDKKTEKRLIKKYTMYATYIESQKGIKP